MESRAPVVLFVYKRPWHTRQTIEALKNNIGASDTELFIYADAPPEHTTKEEINDIGEVNTIIKHTTGFKKIHIIERTSNYGLAASLESGISEVINRYGRVIVLEDDIATSPNFLNYCNQGLDLYEPNKNVYAINGYQYPIQADQHSTFLSPIATSSWGWATWADRWNIFNTSIPGKDLIKNSFFLGNQFNHVAFLPRYNFVAMLDNPKSWAIKWKYAVFIRNGLGLYPTRSLVKNIGFDNSGENCHADESFNRADIATELPDMTLRDTIDLEMLDKCLNYLYAHENYGIRERLRFGLKLLFNRWFY